MKRPWITPGDVRDYSNLDDVKSRSDLQINIDIRRAESSIITYTNNDFSDTKYADRKSVV